MEKKFIRNHGTAGHIEDIVVSENYRGQKLGKRMIDTLVNLNKANGGYKVILDCNETKTDFYKKCGFDIKGV